MEDELDARSTPTPHITSRLSAVSLSGKVKAPRTYRDPLQTRDDDMRESSMEMSDIELFPAPSCSRFLSEALTCTQTPPQVRFCHRQQEAVSPEERETVAPSWAEMLPDALVKIFRRLSLKELLCTIPSVCRYWQCVSEDASCWQTIDLTEWSYDKDSRTLEKMILLLVNRSQGGLRRVCVPYLKSDSMLQLIANSASKLQVLQIPDSFVSDDCLCEVALKAGSLIYLDISGRFPSKALIESFGKHCKFITTLNMNMRLNARESESCDLAALAIAEYMPQLQHLEMAYGLLSDAGLRALLDKCRDLEHLDLRGCWHLDTESALLMDASNSIKAFFSPVVKDEFYDSYYNMNYEDEDDDDDYSCSFMFEDPEDYDEFMCDDSDDSEVYYHVKTYSDVPDGYEPYPF